MFNFKKGSIVCFLEQIEESYEIGNSYINANISSDNLKNILYDFISYHKEELIDFILELPTKEIMEEIHHCSGNVFDKVVYQIDNCNYDKLLNIISQIGEIIFNDGICQFGICTNKSMNKIMFKKYNVVTIFTKDHKYYEEVFKKYGIRNVNKIKTAWDTFTINNPGKSLIIETNGITIYDIPDLLKAYGIYKFETRNEQMIDVFYDCMEE